ncbi:MAG: hypothetical protein ACI4EN_03645 [Butyrivibrio sp.]
MNLYKLLNAGVKPSGSMDFFEIVKWILGLLIIFILVQNYWELKTGKIYIFSYHRFKSKRVWLIKQTAKILGICMLYSGILMGINVIIFRREIGTLFRLWLLYALFVFNMNYIFCILHLDNKVKVAVWIAVFGGTAVCCSIMNTRQYWNISSYGMLLQQTAPNDYIISIVVNIVVAVLMITIKLISFRRRLSK